jgi:hypothetical protein
MNICIAITVINYTDYVMRLIMYSEMFITAVQAA